MSFLEDLMTRVFGEGRYQVGDYSGPREEHIGGLFGKGGTFGRGGPFRREPELLDPRGSGYQPAQQEQPYQPQPAQEEYAQLPGEQPVEQVNQFDFPAGDKPPVPEQYHEQLSEIENSNIVASVLAQETGGYGYQAIDPETGQLVGWDIAQEKNIRSEAGEVGIAQIIPKWYWKDAGFADEESYAQALYDPTFAIQEAGRILNKNFALLGDWKKALGAWNKNPNYPNEVLGRIGIQD